MSQSEEELYYFRPGTEGKWSFIPNSDCTISKLLNIGGSVYTFCRNYYTKSEVEALETEMKTASPELKGPFIYSLHNRNHSLVINVWKPYPSQLLMITMTKGGKVTIFQMDDSTEGALITLMKELISNPKP